jgi:hypothetical protein
MPSSEDVAYAARCEALARGRLKGLETRRAKSAARIAAGGRDWSRYNKSSAAPTAPASDQSGAIGECADNKPPSVTAAKAPQRPEKYPTDPDPVVPSPPSTRVQRAAWYAEAQRVLALRGNWLRGNDARLRAADKAEYSRRHANEQTTFKANVKLLYIFSDASRSTEEEAKGETLDRIALCDITPEDGE